MKELENNFAIYHETPQKMKYCKLQDQLSILEEVEEIMKINFPEKF